MTRFFAIVCFLFLGASLYANIAMPKMPPHPAGDVISMDAGLVALRIEKENLFLDLTGKPDAFSRAVYFVRNPGATLTVTDLWFVTPYMEKVTVTVAGKQLEIFRENITREKPGLGEKQEGDFWGNELKACRFHVIFAPQAVTVIEVSFILPGGYDNTKKEMDVYSTVASHSLNWFKAGNSNSWYLYNLSAANTFTGGIADLDLVIWAPGDSRLDINVAVKKTGEDKGTATYAGSFKGIPAPQIEAKVVHVEQYNFLGATFGLGLHTNYGDDTQFIAQALLDVYLFEHQLSAGVEVNPFGTSLKLPVLYSYFPLGKVNRYVAMFADIRFSAGVLFDLEPAALTGFRVASGLRMLLSVFEISYDFYPFDADSGYVWRMSFLYKMSL